jgi:cellulose synthase/poly-beta-1,6-N-acetylglucosamine synthase-like glycosyltransferase
VDEARYLEFENRLRSLESARWGLAIGLEGGCMLLKRSAFEIVPPGTAVDDFFQNLSVLRKGGRVLFEPLAVAWESGASDAFEEYRRKRRIGRGNRQNLNRFAHLIWKRPFPLGYALLSHKFLRWFAAIWALWLGLGLFWAAWKGSELAGVLFVALFSIALLSLGPLKRLPFFGSIGHFIRMNAALIEGLLLPDKRRSHLWEPTSRHEPPKHH